MNPHDGILVALKEEERGLPSAVQVPRQGRVRRTRGERGRCRLGGDPGRKYWPLGLRFQPPERREDKRLLFKPPCLWYFDGSSADFASSSAPALGDS